MSVKTGEFHFGTSRIVDAATTTSIVRNPDTGEPVSQTNGADKRWYTTNHLGSTVALTGPTGGLARTYGYSIDGTDSSSGTGPEAALRFAGGHRLSGGTLGGALYHYSARYYNTATARWTSLDPLMQFGDLKEANRYAYAAGDPVNRVDPLGLRSCENNDRGLQCGRNDGSAFGTVFNAGRFIFRTASCAYRLYKTYGADASQCTYF